VATHTADELVHCLAVDKDWPAERATLEGKRRQQALDSVVAIQAAQAQAAWIADSQEHRYQLTVQCNYDALERQYQVPRQLPGGCLQKNFGWPADRAQAVDDSIWNLAAPQHAQDVERCHSASSLMFCLNQRGWPNDRALVVDDSVQRSAFIKKGGSRVRDSVTNVRDSVAKVATHERRKGWLRCMTEARADSTANTIDRQRACWTRFPVDTRWAIQQNP
jgi:hypothetical protein